MYTSLAFYAQFRDFNVPGFTCASRLFISSYINWPPKLARFLFDARFHGRLLPRFSVALDTRVCRKCIPEDFFFQLFGVDLSYS